MKKCCVSFLLGCVVGLAVAVVYEDEVYDGIHCVNKTQRKMMRQMRYLNK